MNVPRPPLHIAIISRPDEYTAALEKRQLPSGDAIRYCIVDPHDTANGFLKEANAALLWDCPPSALPALFAQTSLLRWCHWKSAGVENLPLGLFKEHGITLTNSAGVFAESLAEFTLMGLLYFIKDVRLLKSQQSERSWKPYEVRELRDSKALIVGYGGIGKAIAERLAALKVEVIACRNRTEQRDPFVSEVIRPEQIDEVLPAIDHLILSAPLTAETRGIIGAKRLRALKPTAIIVNVGRGPLVEESELLLALKERRIRGAALDVFDVEPLPTSSEFWDLENVLISPHTADRTARWLWDALKGFEDQVARVLRQEPLVNVVSLERGY